MYKIQKMRRFLVNPAFLYYPASQVITMKIILFMLRLDLA